MIETQRLILREYLIEDFDALYEIMSDAQTMQHYPAPFDEERTRGWILWNLENYKKFGFGLWAVVLKETGEFIGDCGITIQNIDGQMLPEIGYHINKKYWRRGFAKEAAGAVRDWVFENTDYNEIYSYMKYTNVASYSTAIANGMKKLKEYADPKNEVSYAYSITRDEWEYLRETDSIDYSNPLIIGKINELKAQSANQTEYIKNAYHFVRDEIKHSWDIKAQVVSKTASEVLKNRTGICWAKSTLLAALLRGNGIQSGISYQKLTRSDEDARDGYIIHALNTIYVPEIRKWIRVDARGNKATVHAQFSTEQEILAFPIRSEMGEVDYHDNHSDLDVRLCQILNSVENIMDIRTDFDIQE